MKTKVRKNNKHLILLLLVIAFSFVCLLTGAWFTNSASTSSNGTKQTFTIGTFGDVSISALDLVWKDINGTNVYSSQELLDSANDSTGIVRENLMPGDKLQSSAINIVFDKDKKASINKAYYLVKYNNEYYIVNDSGTLVKATQAGIISSGTENAKVVSGNVVSITTENGTYQLDGSTSSSSIDNSAQQKNLAELGAKFGIVTLTNEKVEFKVAVIQYANLTSTTAFEQLKSIL